jgi:hypothetical protein
VRLSPDNAVEGVARGSVPSREKESARRLLLAVEPLEQRDELVTERKHAVGVVGEDFAERFIGGIVDDVAARGRRFRFGQVRNARRQTAFDGLACDVAGCFALQLEKLNIAGMDRCRVSVRLSGDLFEPMQRLECLTHRQTLYHAGPPDNAAPEIWNLGPVASLLRANGELAAQDHAERHHGRNADKVGRALHPVGDVGNPRCDGFRQEGDVERRDGREAVREGFRLRPLSHHGCRRRRIASGVFLSRLGEVLVAPFKRPPIEALGIGVHRASPSFANSMSFAAPANARA